MTENARGAIDEPNFLCIAFAGGIMARLSPIGDG